MGLSTFHGALCMQHALGGGAQSSEGGRFCPPVGAFSRAVESKGVPALLQAAAAWVPSPAAFVSAKGFAMAA